MDAKRVFEEFLTKKNLRMTYQRQVILNLFLQEQRHLSPEELYDMVKVHDPSIGQATVYRTLKLLCEAGIAREVEFGDGVMRYEPEYGRAHHDHIICTDCGDKVEVYDPEIEALQEKMAEREGFRLTHHKMYLYGICKKCQKRRRR